MQHPLVKLAKTAVDSYVAEGETISAPVWIPKQYIKEAAGTFVTIKKNGELRGCVGTYAPTKKNIAQEIISNAILAATEDCRFDAVSSNELPSLGYEVYILKQPVPVLDISELDPKIYGVLVKTRDKYKCGLLLPGLEGVDSVEQQLSIACRKAGIDPQTETVSISKFAVEKFE